MQVLLIPKCFAIQPSKNNEILPKELTFWGRTESMEYHHYFKPQACLTLSDTTSRSGGLEAPPSGSPRVPPVPCGGKRRAELAMTGPVFGALATIMPQAALSPSQTRKLGARGGRECLIPIGCRAGGRSIPPFWKVLRRLRRWGTGGGGAPWGRKEVQPVSGCHKRALGVAFRLAFPRQSTHLYSVASETCLFVKN